MTTEPIFIDKLPLIGVIFLLAFLVEALVEYLFGKPFEQFPKLAPWKWVLIYIAAGFGVLCAFWYRLDLVSMIAGYLGGVIEVSALGIILTGLSIGRGANFLHGLLMKFIRKTTG